MSAPIDCPICMDCIESTTKNCVTTECGHIFHTNCLMQNVVHNGFGCPYCRTAMAEEPEEDEETVWSDEEEEEETEEEVFDDDTLRGFRFFFNNLNGVPHDEEDEADEQQFEESEEEAQNQDDGYSPEIPSPQFVADKLRSQGYSFEQLVQIILHDDHDEYNESQTQVDTVERMKDDLFGKLRIIISNYQPQPVDPAPPAATVITEETSSTVDRVDLEAQPKTNQVRNVPSFMVHV